MNYSTVIGLEVHVELKTESKLFCGCPAGFGSRQNTNICPVCTGQPGTLPVLNRKAVFYTVLSGLAVGCRIPKHSVFDRKSYFYPDLPKNYQISQYKNPIAEGGNITLKSGKKIGITRIHLEEDAGKLLHRGTSESGGYSLVDYNRTGVPLMEIVSEPDLGSPKEAYEYLTALKEILQYIGVSDCDMEKGYLRCDANISLSPEGSKVLGTKTELKNMNSFHNIEKALIYEISRQEEVLSSGGKIIQQTLLWDAEKEKSFPMRSKEESHDYRYFPEPDLLPLELDDVFIKEAQDILDRTELPERKRARFVEQFGLSKYDAAVLTQNPGLAAYFETALEILNSPDSPVPLLAKRGGSAERRRGIANNDIPLNSERDGVLSSSAKMLSNWITVELLGKLNESGKSLCDCGISSENMAGLVSEIISERISGKIGKTVFEEMFSSGETAQEIIKKKNLVQITDLSELEKIIDDVILKNPKPSAEYKSGNDRTLGFIVGLVMKNSSGKANPKLVNEIIRKKLKG